MKVRFFGVNPMMRTKYHGYLICQQKEFGPLKPLKWVEDGDFIVVKNNANAIPGATFRTVDDARKTIDLFIETFRTLTTRLEQS
jgi:hypothetical protein